MAGLSRLRSRMWATIPALSLIVFVLLAGAYANPSAKDLTYLALVAVPILAILCLGWLARGARPRNVLVVPVLFGLAWVDGGGLAGQGAASILVALSCAALGTLLAALTPARWLAVGIVLMAVADTALVISDLLQAPNDALNAAHPAGGLPMLQSANFGSAVIGYGDLFVAGLLGALLARSRPRAQLTGALLVAVFALAFDLLFLVVDELPATVPVAIALLVLACFPRRRTSTAPRARSDLEDPVTLE
jgi:hypothetical protein